MKKLIFIVFVVLMLSFVSVSAQETAVKEINWSDVAEAVEKSGIEGAFCDISDIGLMMWIPAVMNDMELTEEDMADGMVAFLATDDGDGIVVVNYMDLEGATLDEGYEGLLEDPSYTDVDMGVINGLKALSYTVPESNMLGISFEDEDGYMAQFLFYPISDEGFAQVASIMAASIQESK